MPQSVQSAFDDTQVTVSTRAVCRQPDASRTWSRRLTPSLEQEGELLSSGVRGSPQGPLIRTPVYGTKTSLLTVAAQFVFKSICVSRWQGGIAPCLPCCFFAWSTAAQHQLLLSVPPPASGGIRRCLLHTNNWRCMKFLDFCKFLNLLCACTVRASA